jgi:hypothetical protein
MSFNVNRDSNNKTIKKKISYSQTPKITSNRTALSNANSVNLQQLSINNVPITANGNNINSLDTNVGIASSNKAIVLDQNKNITNINTITTNSLTVNNESITGIYQNNNPSNSNSPYIKDIESGLVDSNKLATVDNNLSIKNINDISSNSLTLNKNNINFITKSNKTIKSTVIDGDYITFTENYKYNIPIFGLSVFYIDSLDIYMGTYQNKLYKSLNGKDWILLYTNPIYSERFASISYSPTLNMFLTIHQNSNKLYTSTDYGITWTAQTFTGYTVDYNETQYPNYPNTAEISYSFDSTLWSSTLNKFYILSYFRSYRRRSDPSYRYYTTIFTSSNGTTWVKNETSVGSWLVDQILSSITWNNNTQKFEIRGSSVTY